MLSSTTNTETLFLKPRTPFKLSSFKARTLRQIGQQIGLTISLESHNIDVCYLSETCIQDLSEVIEICSPSVASKILFRVHLSEDPVASSAGFADAVAQALETRQN